MTRDAASEPAAPDWGKAGERETKRQRTDDARVAEFMGAGPSSAPTSMLAQMLGNRITVGDFFETVWEKEPRVFHSSVTPPLHRFGDLLGILRNVESEGDVEEACHVLMMKDGCPTTSYKSSAHAYLDGCSIIVNHIQEMSEDVMELCHQLREDLPHAFVNMYLTPPSSQAVASHADDRDVFVWQVFGSKKWKVYAPPPIQFPYPEEQVGKSEEYPVPKDLKVLHEVSLNEGDVLYMPRGYVHEACTQSDDASLHLTVALATHDWSWASILPFALLREGEGADAAEKLQKRLRESGPEMRRSLPPALICPGADAASVSAAKGQVEAVLDSDAALRGKVTAEGVVKAFADKAGVHNHMQDRIHAGDFLTKPCLTLDSHVRRLTEEEKASKEEVKEKGGEDGEEEQGLMARDEIADSLPEILGGLDSSTPVRVEDFPDAPMLCKFSKMCFAEVCAGMGILCACDAAGNQVPFRTADEQESDYDDDGDDDGDDDEEEEEEEDDDEDDDDEDDDGDDDDDDDDDKDHDDR